MVDHETFLITFDARKLTGHCTESWTQPNFQAENWIWAEIKTNFSDGTQKM